MRAILILFLVTLSLSAHATLIFSDHPSIKLYTLDNTKIQSEEIRIDKVGSHQLVVSYTEILKDGSESDIFSSKPYVLEFEVGKTDEQIRVQLPTFRRYNDAVKFFKYDEPEWRLTNQSNVSLDYVQTLLPPSEGFMPYGDVPELVKIYNSKMGNEFSTGQKTNLTEQAFRLNDNGAIEVNADPLIQLKTWYLKASKAERKEFRKWMIDQE